MNTVENCTWIMQKLMMVKYQDVKTVQVLRKV